MRTLVWLGALLMISPLAVGAPPALDPATLPSRPELPDPLVALDGSTIASRDDWRTKRRPELQMLFQELMYGRVPTVTPKVTGKVVHEDKAALKGKATLREIALTVTDKAPPIYVLLVTPNKSTQPVPTFVGLNFCGNHCLTSDAGVRIPDGWMYPKYPGVKDNKATAEGRGQQADVWPLEKIIDAGYALATVYNGDIIPDNPTIRGGLADLLMPKKTKGPTDTATIMAWAWGMSRVADYLATQPGIDSKRLVAVGHSRLGKTAIVAAAFDERFALSIPHQAGCGGTAPDRSQNPKAESVKRINTSFPHWFCDNFKRFNDDTTRLPFDQHGLVALCAPRPVLFTNATEDQWANPGGQFTILQAATPVYQLLGVEGLTAAKVPPEGTLVDSRLGYWVRPGPHSMTSADWEIFLKFSDKWLK